MKNWLIVTMFILASSLYADLAAFQGTWVGTSTHSPKIDIKLNRDNEVHFAIWGYSGGKLSIITSGKARVLVSKIDGSHLSDAQAIYMVKKLDFKESHYIATLVGSQVEFQQIHIYNDSRKPIYSKEKMRKQ